MKRFLNITVMIMVYLLFSAKSCDHAEQSKMIREEARAMAARDSIRSVVCRDTLGDPDLRAFEASAMLKIKDLGDYLGLLADTNTGDVYCDKLVAMTGDLLTSGETMIDLTIPGCKGVNQELAERFHRAGLNHVRVPYGIGFDSIRIHRPLKMVSDSIYSGEIEMTVHCNPAMAKDSSLIHYDRKFIDIVVVNRLKIFGSDSIKSWTALLGDVR